MVGTRWRALLGASVTVALLAFGPAAHAAIYAGHFDPAGNDADIPGFTGDALFDINQECIDLGDGWHSSGTDNECGPSEMTSATVNLYSTSSSDPLTTPIDSFILGPHDVFGVLIAGGQVVGVDTDLMGPAHGQTVYASTFFWLEFDSGCRFDSCFLSDPAYLHVNSVDNPGTANRSAPATVTFTPVGLVPEPGTLGLLLVAGSAAWLRRREQRKP